MPTKFVNILKGDPAKWFTCNSSNSPQFHFHTVAGRYILLSFFCSSATDFGAATQRMISEHRDLFDDVKLSFFGVSCDRRDLEENRLFSIPAGIRYFWDFDGAVSRLYGAIPVDIEPNTSISFRPIWVLIDPSLRVIELIQMKADGSEIPGLVSTLRSLPPLDKYVGCNVQVPILILPNVFEKELCEHLISLYEAHGGIDSGFMQNDGEKTVPAYNYNYKKRRDYLIEDAALQRRLQERIVRRVKPEIHKVHQFEVTRMERYIVGCYSSEDGGHFQSHRDNTTTGTAHRRFAVSINLNDDFDGGEVSFPEYGPQSFKAPAGGAVVFSCSLLHSVSRVTRGRRYAFLPFLYDDAAAKSREENNRFLDPSIGTYTS